MTTLVPHTVPTKKNIDDIFVMLKVVLNSRIAKHGDEGYASTHEALGIITEEFWELVEAVRQDSIYEFSSECTDVAIAAIWALISIQANK